MLNKYFLNLVLQVNLILNLVWLTSAGTVYNFKKVSNGFSGTVKETTRYWDCCKPTCAWNGYASVTNPIRSCKADGVTTIDDNTQSGCVGGSAYVCNDNQPWAFNNTLAFGTIAANINGFGPKATCCSCLLLTFQSGAIKGRQMAVQITNTGNDVSKSTTAFDILIPAAGVGYYTKGCTTQWSTSSSVWGNQYGGVDTKTQCSKIPSKLQSGCNWRFDWMKGVSNPTVTYQQIECPAAITDKTHCIRK